MSLFSNVDDSTNDAAQSTNATTQQEMPLSQFQTSHHSGRYGYDSHHSARTSIIQ
jgi:hypothetical protein